MSQVSPTVPTSLEGSESLVSAALQPMFALQADLVVHAWNEAFDAAFIEQDGMAPGISLLSLLAGTRLPRGLAARLNEFDPTAGTATDLHFQPDRERHARLRIRVSPTQGGDGILVAIAEDRNPREKLAALAETAEIYQDLYENAPDMFASVDPRSGEVLRCNATLAAALGRTKTEILGRDVLDLYHPTSRAAAEDAEQIFRVTGAVHDRPLELWHADGSPIEVSLSIASVLDEGGRVVASQASWRDLSNQKGTKAALRRTETRLAEALRAASLGTFTLDLPSRTLRLDERGKTILGKRGSLKELPWPSWLECVHRDHHRRVRNALVAVTDEGAESGSVCDVEFRVRDDDGPRRHVVLRGSLLQGVGDEPAGVHGVLVDVTQAYRDAQERARLQADAENARLQAKMERIQRLDSLEMLASGMARDFNNLFMVVQSRAELTRMQAGDPVATLEHTGEIERAASRASELTSQLLAYAGQGDANLEETIGVGELAREFSTLLELSTAANARLVVDAADDTPSVRGDRSQLSQVVMNLVNNAAEATGDPRAEVHLSTRRENCDANWLARGRLTDELTPGTYAAIEVADTGHGMARDIAARAFEPFFTTREQGRGLGLAAVDGIVRRHGGAILMDSEPGVGTKVLVLLPAVATELQSAGEATVAPEQLARKRWQVLIVDDEHAVRGTAEKALQCLGFAPLVAPDGASAIELFKADRERLVCVLLDLGMPGMSGTQVLEVLQAIDPDVPIVICSGYTDQKVNTSLADHRFFALLHKPFRLSELHDVLGRAAEERSARGAATQRG